MKTRVPRNQYKHCSQMVSVYRGCWNGCTTQSLFNNRVFNLLGRPDPRCMWAVRERPCKIESVLSRTATTAALHDITASFHLTLKRGLDREGGALPTPRFTSGLRVDVVRNRAEQSRYEGAGCRNQGSITPLALTAN